MRLNNNISQANIALFLVTEHYTEFLRLFGYIPKQLQKLVCSLRESSRGWPIVNGSILTKYEPIYDRPTPGLWRRL